MTEQPATVTLGAQVGGRDADEAMRPHYLPLRQLLAVACVGPYSAILREIALVLRIDGSLDQWERRGVALVRMQRKGGYATADIFVPVPVWRDGDDRAIRAFLAEHTRAAIRQIIERARGAGIPIEAERLLGDVSLATHRYVASLAPPALTVDFANADFDGAVRLVGRGTVRQLEELGVVLAAGMQVRLTDGEVFASATLERRDGIWVAMLLESGYLDEADEGRA